ncbi:MAG: P1 family peptidase [Actinomycetota bacterium]
MQRGRARDHGVVIGIRPTAPLNAITDVAGVRVGHHTVSHEARGDRGPARTGVTSVFPHEGLPWDAPVYVGTHVLNGYGEIIGINQLDEWGILASPIVMTSSLAIGKAYDATVKWFVQRDPSGTADDAVMPVVTECDDSYLSDPLAFLLSDEDVWAALDAATTGPVTEGCVGSGTGMQCFDFKGGIGTSSRVIPQQAGGYVVGALVMTNYGDRPELRIDGVPVGRELTDLMPGTHSEGSCVVVVATDAPMLPHQVRRLARRAALGLARTGSTANNGSGELMLAFSTATKLPHPKEAPEIDVRAIVDGSAWDGVGVHSELFGATVEAVEEAVINALFAAETTLGRDGSVLHALPIDRTLEVLNRHGHLVG